jgi:hypothetical protein
MSYVLLFLLISGLVVSAYWTNPRPKKVDPVLAERERIRMIHELRYEKDWSLAIQEDEARNLGWKSAEDMNS